MNVLKTIFFKFMVVITYIISPILPLFVNDEFVFPSYLSWFQTPNGDMIGNSNYRQNEWQWRFLLNTNEMFYYTFLGWIWKNPAAGLKHKLFDK